MVSLELTTLDTSLIKVLNSKIIIYLAYFEIMLYDLYLHISKTWNFLLSVTNITHLSMILYLISINYFLTLILKLVPLILEIVKILNFVINQWVILLVVILKILTDSRIHSIVSKGPKYRFPPHIDINKCRETIVIALNDYCTRCYAIGGQDAPRVTSNLIKLRVGRCLTVPLHRRL